MATSLETVKKAIEYNSPEYIPCYYGGADSDIMGDGFTWRMLNRTAVTYDTEWGFTIRPNTAPGVAGYHVDRNPLAAWDDYPSYPFPDVGLAKAEISARHAKAIRENPNAFKDKYILGHMTAGPYLIAGMIRGEGLVFGFIPCRNSNLKMPGRKLRNIAGFVNTEGSC